MKRLLPLVIFAIVFACGEKQNVTLLSADSDLQVGVPTEKRTIDQHDADTFKLNVANHALIYGYADQIDVDLVVQIFGPDGKKIKEVDSPSRGRETFDFEAKEAGVYKLVVLPFEDGKGDYVALIRSAEAPAEKAEDKIAQAVRVAIGDDGETPGVTIAVQQDGNIIYKGAFGYADLEHGIKNTPSTVYHIASVSKQFTSFAIAMLADQGKLSLQDDIRKYLPEMHDFGTPITINHLVHHTSGLRDQWNLLMMAGWRLDDVITREQILRVLSRQTELNFKPGEEYVYCNSGFTLMAEIVARVTGEPFEVWCDKNIFKPLDMKSTLFYTDHEMIVKNRAYSYYYSGNFGYKKRVLSYANAGATSLFTTVEDLSLWATNFDNVKVGNDKVMSMMNERFVLNKGDTIKYAFGQVIDTYKGLRNISHGGADAAYRTFFVRFPDEKFSVAVFSNYGSFNTGELAYKISEIYLGDKMKEQKAAPDLPNEPSKPADMSGTKLEDYVGEYYSTELETTYALVLENNELTTRHQRHNNFTLRQTDKDKFNCDILGELTFVREKGKVTGFKASNGRVRNLSFARK